MRCIVRLLSTGLLLALFALPAGPVSAQTTLVPTGSVWRYLDDGSDQGVAWQAKGFGDGTWASGSAQLGYGDGDEATVVSYGPNPNDKHITTYLRHSFEVADPSLYDYLELRLLRDDGAVVYLNGEELQRSNMPADSIGYRTFASSAVGGDDEDAFFEYSVGSSDLDPGTNVLAVEIHQSSITSSDISFDLEVIGLAAIPHPIRKAPYLIYTGDNTKMEVLWQLVVTDSCLIEWGLDQLYGLGSEVTHEYGSDHQHTFTIEGLTPETPYYYRVIARDDTSIGSFHAAPSATTSDVAFFAYGDTRTYPADHDQVAAGMISAFTADPELQSLVISVGDLVNAGDQEGDWDSQFFDPTYASIQTMLGCMPYQACRGNHEATGVVFGKYFPYPFESPMHWSFDYGPAHFVFVDQYVSYAPGSPQYNWIDADLAATTKPWRFLVFHEPGWSAGGGHENNTDAQDYLQPLCLKHCVPITFAGHNHYYSRAEVDHVQHITTGGGGAPLRTPDTGYPNVVTATSAYHFCIIEIDDAELFFVAVSTSGDTIDQFTLTGPVTSVEEPADEPLSRKVVLEDAFPNPFNPATTIAFSLPGASEVELTIFNLNGELIRTLANRELPAGQHRFSWNGIDDAGRQVSSGVYFYRLLACGRAVSKSVVLLK